MMFEYDKVYKVELNGYIPGKARMEIAELVNPEIREEVHGDNIPSDSIVELLWEDYDGFSLVNDRGSIAKRIRRNVFERLGVSLSNEVISEVGNIAANNTVDGEYEWWISKDLYVWTPIHDNISGNSGSCFYESLGQYEDGRGGIVTDMKKSGLYACSRLRWDDEIRARAWVYLGIEPGVFGMFNSYGLSLNKHSIIAATALDVPVTQGRVGLNYASANGYRINLVGSSDYKREIDFVLREAI